MSQSIINALSFLPGWLEVFVISMIPIIELRGAIPFGMLIKHMSPLTTFALAWIGNMIPAPFILLFIPAIIQWMRGISFLKPLGDWIYNKGMSKTEQIAKYKFWGLTIFIAIPLPGTGVWTGCLAGALLGMDFKRGMISAALGAAIAGCVITMLCSLGLMAVGS